jgi:hypothetical protein
LLRIEFGRWKIIVNCERAGAVPTGSL